MYWLSSNKNILPTFFSFALPIAYIFPPKKLRHIDIKNIIQHRNRLMKFNPRFLAIFLIMM